MRCRIDDCDRKMKARGLCPKHYARWRRTGHPESNSLFLPRRDPGVLATSPREEFWAVVRGRPVR